MSEFESEMAAQGPDEGEPAASDDPASSSAREASLALVNKRRWLPLVVAAAVLVVAVVLAGAFLLKRPSEKSPIDVTEEFLVAIANDDCEAMEDLAADEINSIPRDEFIGGCGDSGEQDFGEMTPEDVERPVRLVSQDSAQATVDVVGDPSMRVGLVKDGGEWKVEVLMFPPT